MSNSLWRHGLQHASLPCHSSTHRVCSNSCPSGQWCHPTNSSFVGLISSCLQSFPASESFPLSQLLHISKPKYQSSPFSISLSNEDSGLISFRIDWFDLLAVQGTLKSLIQHHSSRASVFQCSAFFMVQFSHLYMSTEKTIALTRWTFVSKVMSLLFNMLSSFSSKELASFNFMAIVTICSDFGAQKDKVSYCFHCFPISLLWNDGTGCHDLSFLNVEF